MTQGDCLKILEKNKGKWLSTKEIASKLKASTGCIATNLKRLYEHGAVFRKDDPTRRKYMWSRGSKYYWKSK